MNAYLAPTALVDFDAPSIRALVVRRGWSALDPFERIGAAYRFVRDEIAFGYSETDDIPASRVLADGYGQCNTKATLLMALLRALNTPARLHGATIHKSLQRGVVNGALYFVAPTNIIHTWVEVLHDGRWTGLEGVIVDTSYLDGLRARFPNAPSAFVGFGVGTRDLRRPPIDWEGQDTFIQSTGVNQDFGVFDDPDTFYQRRGRNLQGVRAWLYAKLWRHILNRNVARIRGARSYQPASDARCQPATVCAAR